MVRLPFSLEEIRSRGFSVISGEDAARKNLSPSPLDIQTDGLWLIRPGLDKGNWDFPPDAPFSKESELSWRSAVLDENLDSVSLGLPKFLNHGEHGGEFLDLIISDSMSRGDAVLTAKLDGTLIIRSVWNGRVVLRTRNSFFLGPFSRQVMRIVEDRYPFLLDPSWLPDLHLHFEFVSPKNLIIIHYDYDEMVLIHAREDERMLSWEELSLIAEEKGLPLVEDMMMGGVDDPSSLQKRVSELERIGQWYHEGIVIRDPRTGTMAKIKGDDYLSKYRMKYNFSWDDFVTACIESDVSSEGEAKVVVSSKGVDWEILPDIGRWWEIFDERKKRCEDALSWASSTVENDESQNRREFAMMVNSSAPSPMAKSMSFLILDGDDPHDVLSKFVSKEMRFPIGDETRRKTFTLGDDKEVKS